MLTKLSDTELIVFCRQVRRDIIQMVYRAGSGHPGGSLGCVELLVALYARILKYNPQAFEMDGINEDIFILSNGHISPVYYSVLARAGYFPISELATFRKINSRLQGHPTTAEHLPGVRVATGSLGQGLSVAIGAALAKKLHAASERVFVLMGDGEVNEGQIWEAALFAAHHKVDNLIAIIDRNFKQIDGDTVDVMDTGDLAAKFQAFGWQVLQTTGGNDLAAVIAILRQAVNCTGAHQPVMIVMQTVMGKGIDFMEDRFQWHGKPPNTEQFEKAIAQLPPTPFQDF
jgi:transketolase